jgi:septal ring factor EnvC (AmiA/AmiB activator)
MNLNFIPMTCSLALTTMATAFVSTWWPVRDLGADMRDVTWLVVPNSSQINPQALTELRPAAERLAIQQFAPRDPNIIEIQKDQFDALLRELKQLKKDNSAILDQMSEINRDLMELEFRVDTHSESFRPLPVSEDQLVPPEATIVDESQGVLPPPPR